MCRVSTATLLRHSSSSLRPHPRVGWRRRSCVRVVPNSQFVTRSSLFSSRSSFVLCIVNTKYAPCSHANLCPHSILSRRCHPCVCWRRRSFGCVISHAESVTFASLSSSPTFGRLVLFQVTKCAMWAPTCMSPPYPLTYSSLLCVCWRRGSFIRMFR